MKHVLLYDFLFIALRVLYRGNVNQGQLLGPVFQAGYQRIGRIQGGQDIDACLDGIAADDETVMAALCALGRNVDDQVNLMSQYQIGRASCRERV